MIITEYAIALGMVKSYNPYGYTWWLRTPENGYEALTAGYEYFYSSDVGYNCNGVRPAMYIKIK